MWLIGTLSQDKRGVGSIVGASFIVLILLSGYAFYNSSVNSTEHYNRTMEAMSELDWNRNREKLVIKGVVVTTENKLNIALRNDGPILIHLIWLGVTNLALTPSTQQYYVLDVYLDPQETVMNIGSAVTVTSGDSYLIQLVTERGNTVEYKYPAITITGPDTIPYYKNTADWRTYTIQILPPLSAQIPIYFTIYANGSSVSFSDISNPAWVATDANGQYMVKVKSTNPSGETFMLYVVAEGDVGQKKIRQEPK